MSNILINPSSGILEFNTGFASGSAFDTLLSGASRFQFKNSGELNLISYGEEVAEKFTIDGSNGRLFSVGNTLTGEIFSVNDAAGLPILKVESTADFDKVTIGEYGTDALVVSGSGASFATLPTVEGNTLMTGASQSEIDNVSTSVTTNSTNIATNVTNIATNSTAIGTNSTAAANNSTSIATNSTAIGTNSTAAANNSTSIATNSTNIATNVTNIATNSTNIGAFPYADVQSKTSDFTLGGSENGAFVNIGGSATTITVNSDLGAGYNAALIATGAANVTVVGSSSMIVNGTTDGSVTIAHGYQPATIIRLDTNSYAVFGNLV